MVAHRYIGLPSENARYEILRSCVDELCRVKIIHESAYPILPYASYLKKKASRKRVAEKMANSLEVDGDDALALSSALLEVAKETEGFSGRSLRKLPFQAHAFFVQVRH